MRNKTSLRQLAKQLGVSSSYLSQVNTGKRPPSARLLSNADVRRMLNAKHQVDVNTSRSYNLNTGQRSSEVEQRTHKPLVGGSNPPAATMCFPPPIA
jgi:transcriptional regulator with XRE-family HTH domain